MPDSAENTVNQMRELTRRLTILPVGAACADDIDVWRDSVPGNFDFLGLVLRS